MQIRLVFVAKEGTVLHEWHSQVSSWGYFETSIQADSSLREIAETAQQHEGDSDIETLYLIDVAAITDADGFTDDEVSKQELPSNCLLFKEPSVGLGWDFDRLRPASAVRRNDAVLRRDFLKFLEPYLKGYHAEVLCDYVATIWKGISAKIDETVRADPLEEDPFTTACKAMKVLSGEIIDKLRLMRNRDEPTREVEVCMRTSVSHTAAVSLWKNQIDRGEDRTVRNFQDLMIEKPPGSWFVSVSDGFLDFTFLRFFAQLVRNLEDGTVRSRLPLGGTSQDKNDYKSGEWKEMPPNGFCFELKAEVSLIPFLRSRMQLEADDAIDISFLNTHKPNFELSHLFFCERIPLVSGGMRVRAPHERGSMFLDFPIVKNRAAKEQDD